MKIGILGGGQLGKMLIEAGQKLGLDMHVLDPSEDAPCRVYPNFSVGDVRDADAVFAWGKDLDLVTFEWEQVSVAGLRRLSAAGVAVFPDPDVLATIQDKGLQKQFYAANGIPTAGFSLVKSKAEMAGFALPFVQKTRTLGYDGKGVQVVKTLDQAWDCPSVIEDLVPIEKELSVIVARKSDGEMVHFDPVEMAFDPHGNLVLEVIAPAKTPAEVTQKAVDLARKVATDFGVVGLLAVEMFLTKRGEILVNEVAPRPHNSGHHTIEACETSQFEQHWRAILGLEFGSARLIHNAVMRNILGQKTGTPDKSWIKKAQKTPHAYAHDYGKLREKTLRKMGHVTILRGPLVGPV